jgi:site-specific recombinase XerD
MPTLKWPDYADCWHLRHSAASATIAEGVDLFTVGGVLGHKSHASTQRDAHLSMARLTDEVGRLGQEFTHHPAMKKAA